MVIAGTGGLSHQLSGERYGFNDTAWDSEFLDLIETDPERIARMTHHEFMTTGGADSVEEIMWLVMRGALSKNVRRAHRNYYLPMVTGFAQVIFEDLGNETADARAAA